MKAGIWGAGYIACTHGEALRSLGISIGTVVDRDGEKARKFAEQFGAESWGTDPALFLKDDIASVHVCTPPNLHFDMVMFLLNNKKHVLCEKPLCFKDDQAEMLVEKAKEQKVLCGINLNVRFHLACQKARQIVASKDFGRVSLIHGSYMQEFHCLPAPVDWRYNTQLAGRMRAVTEIGTHWMDIAQYISGRKIAAVSAIFGNCHPVRYVEDNVMYADSENGTRREQMEVRSEDIAAVCLRYDNGAIGTMVLSEVSQGRVNRITLEVTGEKKNLWWNSEDNNILNTAVKGGGVNTEIFGFGNGFTDTFRSLIQNFYEAVGSGHRLETSVYPTLEEGAQIVKLCNAILQSSDANGKWVSV